MQKVRCALILDDGHSTLGDIALRLLRLRIDVHYAKDYSEAWLLAQQEAERIGALLFSPTLEFDRVAEVAECLRAGAPHGGCTLVAVGERPDEATRESLRESGVELALWQPFDESALRTIVAAALGPKYQDETRRAPRMPTTLLGRAYAGTRRRDAIVSTLSAGGAFLETPAPLPEGSLITLEIALPGEAVIAKAKVVYATYRSHEDEPSRPTGMGVQFVSMSPAAEEQLRSFIKEQDSRFGV